MKNNVIKRTKRLEVLPSTDKKHLVLDGCSPISSQTLVYDDNGRPICVIPAVYKNRGIVFRVNDRRREAIHAHIDEIIERDGPKHHTALYTEISREHPWLRPRQLYDIIQKYPLFYNLDRGIVNIID